MVKSYQRSWLPSLLCLAFLLVSAVQPAAAASDNDAILRWNKVALQAVVADHSGTFGAPQQGGPTRASRALAIIHIAMYDAVNAIDGSSAPYLPVGAPTVGASIETAVARAAHDTLVAMYPLQTAVFDAELTQALHGVPAKKGRAAGITVGAEAAGNILKARAADGSLVGDTAIPGYPLTSMPPLPGEHQPDPLNPGQGLLTPGWGQVDTFSGIDVTTGGIRIPPPPALTHALYTESFLEVKALGGDGVVTPTIRTQDETEISLFWAYDGTIDLGVPPVLYNQIARVLARQEHNTTVENARLFALVNIAMADAGIACWDGKYFYNLWRPIVGIRYTGSDENPSTPGDPNWTPLGAPASNQSNNGNDFTPPFPSYSSGHATFGAALFRTLENFYGADAISFRLISDELHGGTTGSDGSPRYTVVRPFDSFSSAAIENARSRIFLGVHWQFDADSGVDQGNKVADFVFANLLVPAP